jgi:hypothetical protein
MFYAKLSAQVLKNLAAMVLLSSLFSVKLVEAAPDALPPSEPFDLASLPAEIRPEIGDVVRTCRSPVTVMGGFSSYLVDHNDRFIVFHFEKIRCDDLTTICKARGCLHQLYIYISKDNRPYELERSTHVSEIELKYIEGKVAVVIISSERTRVLRWNGRGFAYSAAVRFWPLADIPTLSINVRFWRESGRCQKSEHCQNEWAEPELKL